MRKYATLNKATEVALRSEEEDPRYSSLCITLRRRTESIGNVCASGSLMGIKASRLARALSDPLKRRLTPTEERTTEAKCRFRQGIAERGEGHMKGVESIYTSGEEAIEAGSAV
jgi:hypothetical protein